jgi:transposase
MIPARFAGDRMRRFVEGTVRWQSTLFPECLGDWISEDNPVRVIDVFVDELDLAELGFNGVEPEVTGRPYYHPSVQLKLYIYGYLNRIQSRARGWAQRRGDVADGTFGFTSQDDCRFP